MSGIESSGNPPKTGKTRAKDDRNGQKSCGISCAVTQISEYLNKFDSQKGNFHPNADVIGNVLSSLQAQYDLESGQRIIRANYISVTGWISGTNNHDPVAFESNLERDCAFMALFEPRITQVVSQPYTILYKDKNRRQRRYTPDFEFSYLEEGVIHKAVIEVKPIDILRKDSSKFKERYQAMEELAHENGHTFYVLTENQIRTPRLLNTKALYARIYDHELNGCALSDFFYELSPHLPCTMSEAVSIRGSDQLVEAECQSLVWALLAGHELHADIDSEITYDTMLSKHIPTDKRPLFFYPGEDWES